MDQCERTGGGENKSETGEVKMRQRVCKEREREL